MPCPAPPAPCSDRVQRALTLCARDLFVPAPHRDEAFVDAPIRVEAHDFNISVRCCGGALCGVVGIGVGAGVGGVVGCIDSTARTL